MKSNRKNSNPIIKNNIENYGCHIYVVSQGMNPRFAYTIGLTEKFDFEIIMAGGSFYNIKEVENILEEIISKIEKTSTFEINSTYNTNFGNFSFRKVEKTWVDLLLLGAIDFYQNHDINAIQIQIDKDHWTIDVPDLSVAWDAKTAPAWRWLAESWSLPIPPDSTATTNIDALRGRLITEAARWEENDWELFAGSGPDTSIENMRVVPIGTLLTYDPSLSDIMSLSVGEAIWRDTENLQWNKWERLDR